MAREVVIDERLPMTLAAWHRDTAVGDRVDVTATNAGAGGEQRLLDLLIGAGFGDLEPVNGAADTDLTLAAVRQRSLPDTVGPGMRMLTCGLNPSLYAADAGVGYARPGNRFWPMLLAAGLATVDRDQEALLADHSIGMTDLVKRASVGANDVTTTEFAEGLARVERLCAWLRPSVVYMVGLQGWRAAVDRSAAPGFQERRLGSVPVYVAPSTSGANAATRLADHVDHVTRALGG